MSIMDPRALLTMMWANHKTADQLRHAWRLHNNQAGARRDTETDACDAQHFQQVKNQIEDLSEYDLFVAVRGDGLNMLDNGNYESWFFHFVILNLPPEIRVQEDFAPIFSFIPGPKKPSAKCFRECMSAMVDVLISLEEGFPIEVFDPEQDRYVRKRCRVFMVHAGGDYPALNSMTCMRGVNARFPCVYCYIGGCRHVGARTYYVPMDHPVDPDGGEPNPPVERPQLHGLHQAFRDFDFHRIAQLARTDWMYQAHIAAIQNEQVAARREEIAKNCGLNSTAPWEELRFCKNPSTYGIIDPFHLICENVIPLLYNIFAGKLEPVGPTRPVDLVGEMPFQWTREDLQFVEECLRENGKYIPTIFGRLPRPFSSSWKGSEKLVYGLLLAVPIYYHLYAGNPATRVYFDMYYALVRGLELLMQRTVLEEHIAQAEIQIRTFILLFEQHIYAKRSARLNFCRNMFHLLVHLPDLVRRHGPLQHHWCFLTERLVKVINDLQRNFKDINRSAINNLKQRQQLLILKFSPDFAHLYELACYGQDRSRAKVNAHPMRHSL
ncbi:hypothetical protein BCR44DRAFT_1215589 [Catenaria anguillulae PL171]|uniref:Transposase domain-containing protein n=1 Tax=Catenaria anguillulae PL171 TaxID=765915 RepID=A0A1Y2HYT9_9FUNG|nr:hypothetical protein BCR44DRAFT_1215589 [Catenaria anguillulae PL171]